MLQDVWEAGETIHTSEGKEARKTAEHPQAAAELGSGTKVKGTVASVGL